MEGTKKLPVSRKLKILDSSPFKDKTSWQSDFTSPVIKNVRLRTVQKVDPVPSKEIDTIAKVKPTVRPETLYHDEYTEKDLPVKCKVWIPNEHLVFKGTMKTSSLYDNEYHKKNSERDGYCKRVQTLFKGLNTSSKSKLKSKYMDDFPIYPPKKVFYLPPLPKEKQRAKKVDTRSRKLELETTYVKDYIELNLERPYRHEICRAASIGMVPRLTGVRFDSDFMKSVTADELARVAERFPRGEKHPCRPINECILKFDGKIKLDTLYDSNNYADPANKRWFTGHRLDWKPTQQRMKPKKLNMTSKVLGEPLTWRYQ